MQYVSRSRKTQFKTVSDKAIVTQECIEITKYDLSTFSKCEYNFPLLELKFIDNNSTRKRTHETSGKSSDIYK